MKAGERVEPAGAAASNKRPYEPPAVEKVGRVEDVTQGVIGAGSDAALLGSQ